MLHEESTRWVPGTVFSLSAGRTKLSEGQGWVYVDKSSRMAIGGLPLVHFEVRYTSAVGEVLLRPLSAEDHAVADSLWPDLPFEKGPKAIVPFRRVTREMARADKTFRLMEGDFLAHEAWTCWHRMSLMPT